MVFHLQKQGYCRWGLLLVLLFAGWTASAQLTVKGSIKDATTNEPLIGANILIKNTSSGTVTDFDGNFELKADANAVLVVSYTGYITQEVAVNGRTQIDLMLEQESEVLDEVVIVAYGTVKKSDLTGSVARVESQDIIKIPTPSVAQALQGKLAGVQVIPVSGQPGADAFIRIRGTGTLNDSSPLFVVDGMIVSSIAFLNPNDIDQLTVLKDASATALYGSRAANGVVLITTRKGYKSEKSYFDVNAYYGQQSVIDKIELANATEYAQLINQLDVNEGRPARYANPSAFGEGTDWQDVIFRPAGIQSYQVSAGGGSEKTSFNLSANFLNQEGIIRNSDFQRFTFRLNNDYRLRSNFMVGHNVALIFSKSHSAPNVLLDALRVDPISSPTDSLGRYVATTEKSQVPNPEANLFYNSNNEDKNYQVVGSVYGELEILKNLKFRSSAGIESGFRNNYSFTPKYFVSALQQAINNSLTKVEERSYRWLLENTLTYAMEFGGNQRLDLLGGVTAQYENFEKVAGSRNNFLGEDPSQYYLNAGEGPTASNENFAYDKSILSYLFRANYSLLNRYLLTVSMRADGSSLFARENRWGYFPAVALGWNLTNENFMQNQKLFSRLKARASWGRIGNDRQSNYYPYTVTLSPNRSAVFGTTPTLYNGVAQTRLANRNVRWESTDQFNAGLETGFFENQLTFEADYYVRITNDILLGIPIPDYVGLDAPVVNAAQVLNRGIDLTVNWRKTGKFTYNIGANLSTVHNEVLELSEGQSFITGGGLGFGGFLGTRTEIGQPIGSFYGYKTIGVFQNQEQINNTPNTGVEKPGDLIFQDTNKDGKIDATDMVFLGSPIPTLIYGINLGANWKGFDVSVDFNGQHGSKVINAKAMSRFGAYNFESRFLDSWNGEGTSTTEPRVTTSGVNYNPSDRFMYSGDFFRVRQIALGYTLPESIASKIRMRNLRVYVSGTNIFTWKEYSGYTPEIQNGSVTDAGIDRGIYPLAKVYTIGLSTQF